MIKHYVYMYIHRT